jgi:hypothetical protein
MSISYATFLANQAELVHSSKNPDLLTKRFFILHAIPEEQRDNLDHIEYKALQKVMKTRWRAQQEDEKTRKLIGKHEADHRKKVIHAKILLGLAAIDLAEQDDDLRRSLFARACALPSANIQYVKELLGY